MTGENLLGVPPTLLNPEDGVAEALAAEPLGADSLGAEPLGADSNSARERLEVIVRSFPTSSLVWALLSDEAFAAGQVIPSYAYARVGYHRGLDALRKGGWRGQGPVPWSHEPNRGVLRSLYALRRAAEAIGEADEVTRLGDFLQMSDPGAVAAIEAETHAAPRAAERAAERSSEPISEASSEATEGL
ncbi:MAG: hypothetical protein JWQ19_1179 [Subtercola sp.]|nr:hypothetical protein [Subtercola sp.]